MLSNMLTRLILFIWFTIFVFATGLNIRLQKEKFAIEEDKAIPSTKATIGEMKDVSHIFCASWCAGYLTCCSASFDKSTKQCMLYSCCISETELSANRTFIRKLPYKFTDIFHDCSDIPEGSASGTYTMYHSNGSFDAYCDMTTDGKWTVIQKRLDGTTDFYRNWQEYKQGFGNVNCEYWLGNDNMHNILSTKDYTLRIDLQDWNNETRYAEYDTFFIGNETTYYKLTIGDYNGTVGDSILSPSLERCTINGMAFSTFDTDNDNDTLNCALDYEHAGWWFNGCTDTNLNGIYYNGGVVNKDGMYWKAWYGSDYSLKTVAMKIRPKF